MKLGKLITGIAAAGICILGGITTVFAQGNEGTIVSTGNTSPQALGSLNLNATVAPSAILFLDSSAFEAISADPAYTLTGTQVSATPVTLSGSSALQGDGTTSNSAFSVGGLDTFNPIYVSLYLSTASATDVTLKVTDTGLSNATSGSNQPTSAFTFPTDDLTWLVLGTPTSTDALGNAISTGITFGSTSTAADSGSTAQTLISTPESGIYQAEQQYSLEVPWGTPAGLYTDVVTYTISAF